MAPPHRLAATPISSGVRHAQPSSGRPPLSQQYVDRHPERCYAPRLMPIPLPGDAQPALRPSPHIRYTTAYTPTRTSSTTNGALHLSTAGDSSTRGGPNANAPPYYLMAHPTVSIAAPPPPPPYHSVVQLNQPARVVPAVRSVPIPTPKPREPSSPPTPDATPPRTAPSSRRYPGYAQHGRSPTT